MGKVAKIAMIYKGRPASQGKQGRPGRLGCQCRLGLEGMLDELCRLDRQGCKVGKLAMVIKVGRVALVGEIAR